MFGEKAEELAGVARIGLERLWRHALLGAEIAEPARDFGGDVGGDCVCCVIMRARELGGRAFERKPRPEGWRAATGVITFASFTLP